MPRWVANWINLSFLLAINGQQKTQIYPVCDPSWHFNPQL